MYKVLWLFALRNVIRRKLQTILISSMIVLTTALIFCMVGLQTGSDKGMQELYTSLFNGDLQVRNSNFEKVEEYDRINQNIADDYANEVIDTTTKSSIASFVTKRAANFGLISFNNKSYAVGIVGIEPDLESKVSKIASSIVKGEFLASEQTDGVVIGYALAEYLGVKLGDEVLYLTQDKDSGMLIEPFVVSGIFNTGMEGLDKNLTFINLDTFQNLIFYEPLVGNIVIKLQDSSKREQLAKYLKKHLDLHKVEVLSWKELFPELQSMMSFNNFINYIYYLVFILLIAFIVLNSMVLSTIRRMKEFGLLAAIGLPDKNLSYILIIEVFIITIVSIIIGSTIGIAITYYYSVNGFNMHFDDTGSPIKFPTTIYPNLKDIRMVFGPVIIFIFCMLSIIPSIVRLRKSNPIEAITSN